MTFTIVKPGFVYHPKISLLWCIDAAEIMLEKNQNGRAFANDMDPLIA